MAQVYYVNISVTIIAKHSKSLNIFLHFQKCNFYLCSRSKVKNHNPCHNGCNTQDFSKRNPLPENKIAKHQHKDVSKRLNDLLVFVIHAAVRINRQEHGAKQQAIPAYHIWIEVLFYHIVILLKRTFFKRTCDTDATTTDRNIETINLLIICLLLLVRIDDDCPCHDKKHADDIAQRYRVVEEYHRPDHRPDDRHGAVRIRNRQLKAFYHLLP